MGILGRYLIGRVLLATLLVSVLLVGIYSLIEFIREARAMGGDYGLLQVLWYLINTTPRRLYDIFPFAVLIGTLLGLGGLAASNELVAMRAAGFDRRAMVVRVLLAVLACLVVLLLLAELVIPHLEPKARAEREQARSGQIHLGSLGGLWLRDGPRVVKIGYSAWVGDDRLEFGDLLIYELDDNMRPRDIVSARRASHDSGHWQLFGVESRSLGENGVVARVDELALASDLSPELFAATVSRPRLLAMRDLLEMRAFLIRNGLDAEPYQQAFWDRLFFPVNVLAMVLIGLPFVFRSARQGGGGLNLFAGVAVGLLFFVLSRLAQGVTVLMPVPLWVVSLLPALLIAALAGVLLKRL
jgi:lipopolysaccharide export system permease protein